MSNRVLNRAVAAAAVGPFVFLVPAGLASATPVFGYTAGSGGNTSSLVIDFRDAGGGSYLFEYAYDGEATGEEMLEALDAAGDLDLIFEQFSFGKAIYGFTFDGQSAEHRFGDADGKSWQYWIDGGEQDVFDFSVTPAVSQREAVAMGAYVFASSGAGSRYLSDGSVDGWVAGTSVGAPPAAVPEPAAALVGMGAVALLRRRGGASA